MLIFAQIQSFISSLPNIHWHLPSTDREKKSSKLQKIDRIVTAAIRACGSKRKQP